MSIFANEGETYSLGNANSLNNFGIGKVIRTENSSVEVGQHIYGVIRMS